MNNQQTNDESVRDGLDGTTGIIAYFTRNPVAANLMMFFIIIVGIASFFPFKNKCSLR